MDAEYDRWDGSIVPRSLHDHRSPTAEWRHEAIRRRVSPIRWLMLVVLQGTPALGGWAWWSRGHRSADALARGRAAYDRGDWEEAARLARERLKVARDDPE